MTWSMLRAGAWPAVVGVSGAAVVLGGLGVAFPAAVTENPLATPEPQRAARATRSAVSW